MNFTGFIGNGLARILGDAAAQTVCRTCDAAWGWFCLMVVPVAGGAVIAMSQEQPSVTAVRAPTVQLPVVQVDPRSASTYVSQPLSLGPRVTKAQFDAYLVNEQGEISYRYPTVILDRPDERIDAGDLSFKVPTITPGSYYLKADILYPLNPLKNADLKVEMARVIVKE